MKVAKWWIILLVAGLIIGFAGCPTDGGDNGKKGDDDGEYAQYFDPSYRNNNTGSVRVYNPTADDRLLFINKSLLKEQIVGGVLGSSSAKVNFSDQSDYAVGGYKIIYAVRLSEYKTAGVNSNVDYIEMITYRNGSQFEITIRSRYDGDYQFTAVNRSEDYPVELHKNGEIGEKIGFLAKGEPFHVIKTQTQDLFSVTPVWIAFDKVSKSIVPFCPKDDVLAAQLIQPKPVGESNQVFFPAGGETQVKFEIDFPYAIVQVQNNTSITFVFRTANNIERTQGGIEGITSGLLESYNIRSSGAGLNLNLATGATQQVQVPVRFQDDADTMPVLENGWVYNVELNLKPGGNANAAADYTAWLVKSEKPIDQTDFLTAD